jgi:murein DD-endopeptidase MepM/ murein hydrolase activator NlpD
MKNYTKIILAVLILALAAGGFLIYKKYFKKKSDITIPSNQTSSASQPQATPTPQSQFAEPIAEYNKRITKKPFGIYVTPQNSPVSPERFTGYHTGVDIEYTDVTTDVPIYAIADSTVELARTASGYGGVMVLSFDLNAQKTYAVYGHLRLSSMTQKTTVKKGEQIALLGTGYSTETDGERHHLHFAILKKQTIDLKGYVPTLVELNSGWYNPLDIVK